jgi:signal transduction histidine kinase
LKVQTRLVLFAVVAPTIALIVSSVAAGQLFRMSLVRAVDRELVARAAVESVSLFDRPGGEPHVHLGQSPLDREVQHFEAHSALFGPDGARVAGSPGADLVIAPRDDEVPREPGAPLLRTRRAADGHDHRELLLRVLSEGGARYVLVLGSSLADVDATMRLYYEASLSICAGLAIALSFLSVWQARRIATRLGRMATALPSFESGRLDWKLPPDETADEIAALGRALEQAAERLRAAREAEARFIANAAHELRTPLGVMRTEMDLALRKERSPDELKEALGEARNEVDRLASLAGKLLDLTAAQAADRAPEKTDVAAIVRRSADAAIREARGREVEITCEAPDHLDALVDSASLRQAVDNLLTNAVRYAPERSTVRVALAPRDEAIVVTVEDEGPGVPEAERERVFEPFFRGAGKRGDGSGLGLAIVREVAERHGGRAYVDRADRGARFVVELPRSP